MEKENFRETQYGWTIVEKWNGVNGIDYYDIQDKANNRYKVPQEIWDALSSATYRAETYRKSRDHFRESRDLEKERASAMYAKATIKYESVVKDLQNEVEYLNTELEEIEGILRNYKAGVILLAVISVVCICATFII